MRGDITIKQQINNLRAALRSKVAAAEITLSEERQPESKQQNLFGKDHFNFCMQYPVWQELQSQDDVEKAKTAEKWLKENTIYKEIDKIFDATFWACGIDLLDKTIDSLTRQQKSYYLQRLQHLAQKLQSLQHQMELQHLQYALEDSNQQIEGLPDKRSINEAKQDAESLQQLFDGLKKFVDDKLNSEEAVVSLPLKKIQQIFVNSNLLKSSNDINPPSNVAINHMLANIIKDLELCISKPDDSESATTKSSSADYVPLLSASTMSAASASSYSVADADFDSIMWLGWYDAGYHHQNIFLSLAETYWQAEALSTLFDCCVQANCCGCGEVLSNCTFCCPDIGNFCAPVGRAVAGKSCWSGLSLIGQGIADCFGYVVHGIASSLHLIGACGNCGSCDCRCDAGGFQCCGSVTVAGGAGGAIVGGGAGHGHDANSGAGLHHSLHGGGSHAHHLAAQTANHAGHAAHHHYLSSQAAVASISLYLTAAMPRALHALYSSASHAWAGIDWKAHLAKIVAPATASGLAGHFVNAMVLGGPHAAIVAAVASYIVADEIIGYVAIQRPNQQEYNGYSDPWRQLPCYENLKELPPQIKPEELYAVSLVLQKLLPQAETQTNRQGLYLPKLLRILWSCWPQCVSARSERVLRSARDNVIGGDTNELKQDLAALSQLFELNRVPELQGIQKKLSDVGYNTFG